MSNKVKLGFYIVLTLGACVFGFFAWKNYDRLMNGVQSNAKDSSEVPALEGKSSSPAYGGYSAAMTFGALFFITVLGLGLFVGHDISQFFGNRALKVLYNDEGVGQRDPQYEQAEQMWADGHHLEAIRLMREYLQRNPREQHVALRIAEIYEKDLQNHLAAALEYEEVLKQNLPRERWGWAAVHLCNLYLKLGQPDKTMTLLRRIEAEYGETQAAEKARKRLALLEAETGQGSPGLLIEGNAPGDSQQTS